MNSKNPSPTPAKAGITNKKAKVPPPLKSHNAQSHPQQEKEVHGFADQGLLEPTRYGDWDVKGRCSDF